MAEITDSEIDVEQLMAEIRAAVAKREAEGQQSLVGASLELHRLLATTSASSISGADVSALSFRQEEPRRLSPLRLQPEFVPRADDHYHVNDLLQYHDHTFIWNAYRAILKREPDEEGLRQFLGKLRGGRFNKIDVLASLRRSPEGKSRNVRVDGLTRHAIFRRFYRLPVLGYLLELAVGIAKLPVFLRSQREFEGYALAQQDLITSHLNQLSTTSFQVSESLSRELAEVSTQLSEVASQLSKGQQDLAESATRELNRLSADQRKFGELQYQQIIGLFREQREIVERLKVLKDEINARLARLDESLKNGAVPQAIDEQASSNEKRRKLDELFASFPEQFRGLSEEIKEGLRFYLPILKSAGITGDVLDLGCGRGEWLELLKEEGIGGSGVEANSLLVERARSLGLEVLAADALKHLSALPSESLSAVTGFHFIEHLSFETFVELLGEIKRTLRPSGLVIFETPNPKNLVVGACNFYSDPTHLKPLFPESVQFIMSRLGFTDVRVEYLHQVGGSPFDDESVGSRALNSWLYGARDFALIGRRA